VVVYTIGHSTRPLEEFVEALRSFMVERVADVRTVPRSRRNPQFEGAALARSLPGLGIEHLQLKSLGGLRHPRPDSPNSGWRNESFRGYADYMQPAEFAVALDELVELAAERRTAIMCAEAVPWRCHRSLIADALVARGVTVEHIMGVGVARPHVLNPMAVVANDTLTYPG
jgi:uncharacterized protein (DUF488 family)